MRLTLRTLLAYMDNILDPDDAQLIGKKIEESEFATGLLHRVRDCMRRLRLGAPGVMDEGKGFNPNTVAEYLDNTLAADRVADFERVCLESDVHLAEVASCHQILTMVLGEPAEVDPASRARMYALAEQDVVKATPSELPSEGPQAELRQSPSPIETRPTAPRVKPELPDYLWEARARRQRIRLTVETLLLLALGILLVVTSNRARTLLGRLGPGRQEPPAAEATVAAGPDETVPAAPAGLPPEVATSVEPAAAPAEPTVLSVPESATSPLDAQPVPVQPAEPKPEALAPVPTEPTPTETPEQPGGQSPAEVMVDILTEPAPLPPEPVGQLDSPGQVLAKLDESSEAWWRVADRASLVSGDTFVALPTYRPAITLGKDVRLMLVDDTRIRLLANDSAGVPGVAADHGQLLIQTAGQPGAKLRLQIGDRTGIITLTDAEATVAVEVGRRGPSTTDPETEPAALAADLYATRGTVSWQTPPSGEILTMTAPGRLSLDQTPLVATTAEQVPEWARTDTVNLLDQRASATVESQLSQERPIALTLRELADHRQREVRKLAIRSLGAIGDFEPLVKALDDPGYRMVWPDYFCVDLLRTAIARSPEGAADVRAAMKRLHRGQGTDLYEMLWRYDGRALTREDAQRLVDFLDHDSLAFRRLSFWNLRRMTGMGFYYEPEGTAASRRAAVQRWKDRIKEFEPAAGKPAP